MIELLPLLPVLILIGTGIYATVSYKHIKRKIEASRVIVTALIKRTKRGLDSHENDTES